MARQKLDVRQARFAEAVAQGRTPEQAVSLAGYSPSGARATAKRLLAQDLVQIRIAQLKPNADETKSVTLDWVVGELRDLALAAKADGDRSTQLRAMDMLAKHVGAYERDRRAGAPVVNLVGLDRASLEEMARPALEAEAEGEEPPQLAKLA